MDIISKLHRMGGEGAAKISLAVEELRRVPAAKQDERWENALLNIAEHTLEAAVEALKALPMDSDVEWVAAGYAGKLAALLPPKSTPRDHEDQEARP